MVSGIVDETIRYRALQRAAVAEVHRLLSGFCRGHGKARALLPKQVALRDAVENMKRTALITSILPRQYSLLRGLFDDRLHQPYRKKLIPMLDNVIAAVMPGRWPGY